MATLERIGNVLKQLRESVCLSQTQVAKYLGVDQSMLSMVEAGQRSFATEQLQKLLDLYGYDMSIFKKSHFAMLHVQYAYRANTISQEDLQVIAVINKIAANSRMMKRLQESAK